MSGTTHRGGNGGNITFRPGKGGNATPDYAAGFDGAIIFMDADGNEALRLDANSPGDGPVLHRAFASWLYATGCPVPGRRGARAALVWMSFVGWLRYSWHVLTRRPR